MESPIAASFARGSGSTILLLLLLYGSARASEVHCEDSSSGDSLVVCNSLDRSGQQQSTTGWTSDLELAKEKQAGSEVKEAATPSEISAQSLLKGGNSSPRKRICELSGSHTWKLGRSRIKWTGHCKILLGVLRYKQAVTKLANRASVTTKFHPYMIDPATNMAGEEYMAYNKRRWGSDSWTRGLRASGKSAGATFGNWKWWPNTLKAHQLITLAEEDQELGEQAKEALFRATYEEGENVSDDEVLHQIAEKLGISNADQKLPSKGLRDAVIASDTYAKQDMDIHGVPHFIIGSGRKGIALHGAQSVEAFELALEKQIASLAKT